MSNWISPAAAADMTFDDPAREGPGDYGFAILWAKGKVGRHSTADLARAKLQPRKPTAAERRAAGSAWVVTARDHSLLLAPGTPDLASPQALFEAYDATLPDRQNVLAVVETLRFDQNLPRHTMMQRAYLYASLYLQPRALSSLVVLHMPGDIGSDRQPHAHIVTLARRHYQSGFAAEDPLFSANPADMHREFRNSWLQFNEQVKVIELARSGP